MGTFSGHLSGRFNDRCGHFLRRPLWGSTSESTLRAHCGKPLRDTLQPLLLSYLALLNPIPTPAPTTCPSWLLASHGPWQAMAPGEPWLLGAMSPGEPWISASNNSLQATAPGEPSLLPGHGSWRAVAPGERKFLATRGSWRVVARGWRPVAPGEPWLLASHCSWLGARPGEARVLARHTV